MFKKLLLKSVVGATAAGSLLAVSLVATPAVTTAAPEIRTVGYPASISTSTHVSVSPALATYGQTVTGKAKVTAGSRTPRGSVHFVLRRSGGGTIKTWTVTLRRGVASVTLPRVAARSSYTLSARYWAPSGSVFKNSGGSASYTVYPAPTTTKVNAPDVWVLNAAHASAVVGSGVGTPTGSVRFDLLRSGHRVTSKTAALRSGKASVGFGKIPAGRYTVRAVYLGALNYKRSVGSDDFRVTK